jgi:hypothetical protein
MKFDLIILNKIVLSTYRIKAMPQQCYRLVNIFFLYFFIHFYFLIKQLYKVKTYFFIKFE